MVVPVEPVSGTGCGSGAERHAGRTVGTGRADVTVRLRGSACAKCCATSCAVGVDRVECLDVVPRFEIRGTRIENRSAQAMRSSAADKSGG